MVGTAVIGGVLVATIILVLSGGGGPLRNVLAPGPTASPVPPRERLVLPLARTTTVKIAKRNTRAARDAAAAIQATLSGFYDAAFMDPKTWTQGLPAGAWKAFAGSLRDRAQSDADALTLGTAAPTIERLAVTHASLSVRLLLDPRGRPTAAFASVALDASGAQAGGEPVVVTNRTIFLLRPSRGQWLVVGYPSASTNVESPPPPSPGATVTPSSTESPSPGASP